MTIQPRLTGSLLAALTAFGPGCGSAPDDPIPHIRDLACQLSYDESTSNYKGDFELSYVDEDRDLGAGGAVEWWLNGEEQPTIDLTSLLLSEGTLTLSLTGFPAYDELTATFQLIDGAGHLSNKADVYLYTVVGSEECRLTSLGE